MSNTQGLGQRSQNQTSPNMEKQEQARNVDRSSKRGEIGGKQEPRQHGQKNDAHGSGSNPPGDGGDE